MKRGLTLLLLAVAVAGCSPKKPIVETLKKEGEVCVGDESCETGLCDAAPGAQTVCVRKCASGCLASEVCTQLTPNRFACQPDKKQLCGSCAVDSDCPYPADKCIVVNGDHVCGRDCAYDQTCPADYQCVNARGVDGTAKVQQCTPKIASCACVARGDFNEPCEVTNSFGTCSGKKVCDLVANTIACNARTPAAEVCNNIDDNCDGRVDENQATVSCGVGECARTVSTCGADAGVGVCTPGAPIAELCNGKDDDCDGVIDNGFPVETDINNCGACGHVCATPHATPGCAAKQCTIGKCDTGWADCNGNAADGCEVDTNSVDNCGGCGNSCMHDATTTASCVNKQCVLACAPGYYDVDGNAANGCECHKTSDTDYPDMGNPGFIDANCDGIDGEVNNGIFVSSTGDDSNPGTMAQPKKTLTGPQGALYVLGLSGKRDIYMTAGTFAGPLELDGYQKSVVAGGYSPDFKKRSISNATTITGGNPALVLDTTADVEVQLLTTVGDNATAASPGLTAYGAWVKDSTNVKLTGVTITAGDGFAGASATGTLVAGANGGKGGDGDPGNDNDKDSGDHYACQLIVPLGGFDNNVTPTPGAGGTSSCAAAANGGAGGAPSRQLSTSSGTSTVNAGNAGSPAAGGAPGGAGMLANGTPATKNNGSTGFNGADGTSGAIGTGTLGVAGWVPGNGADGTAGVNGKGGGGGGGGAGGWVHWAIPWVSGADAWCQGYGSGGGGGGAGGCGGAAGLGGKGGGASIGLYIVGASTIVSSGGSTIRVGNGGAGGAGLAGTSGGSGGLAGASPKPYDQNPWNTFSETAGGAGGPGGKGGSGGNGAGGSGGAVYGYVRASAASVSGTLTVQTPVGKPGAAGGGPIPGKAGPAYQLSTTY